jgi:hypothetical protein
MDEKEDYPIKVLDIAPLIMVTLPTVSSFFSPLVGASFEVVDPPRRSPSSLSLSYGWPPGTNGSLLCEWRRLPGFSVEDPSGARKGGPNRPLEWARPADLGPPRPGSVAPSLPWFLMHLCTLPLPLA